MAMPPNPTPENALWWSTFHFEHGMDSATETSFVGYLHTRNTHPHARTPDQLNADWSDYLAYVETSREA